MPSTDRRKFIKQGLLGVTGAGLAAHSLSHPNPDPATSKTIRRTLGKTGITLPVVSMGTGDTDNPNLVKAAMDGGIMLYATSRYYGNGRNEEMMGKVLKDRPGDSYIIATSV